MSGFNYRDLHVWQKAIDFVTECYHCSQAFPAAEIAGLTSQIRRAAVSVASNIAEGHGRSSTRDYIRFLNMAYGSLCEVETQLCIATRLEFLQKAQADSLSARSVEIAKMLNALIASLERKLAPEKTIIPPTATGLSPTRLPTS